MSRFNHVPQESSLAQEANPQLIRDLAAFALRHPDLEDGVLGLNAASRKQFEEAKSRLIKNPSDAGKPPEPENLAAFNRPPTTNTLRSVTKQAEYNYQQHRRGVEQNERFYNAPLGAAALAGVEALTEKGNPGRRKGEGFDEYKVRVTQGRVKGNLERAAEHFSQHRGEYYDLAVIDAHLDGVKISVVQPLEIGQKNEVHAPEHQ